MRSGKTGPPPKAVNMEALWAIANGANQYENVPNEFPAERNTVITTNR